jgi:A/G-specific adenine glycosylase
MAGRSFASRVIAWQRRHGRHDLPWQGSRDPYRIWIAEVMLQQTRVATVIPYYRRFVTRFPDVTALAVAAEDEVLRYWAGLGYYSRARNLWRAASAVVARHRARVPAAYQDLLELPGIGRSTAAAIAAFAAGERRAILDGNVKRVLARHRGVRGWPGERPVQERLWSLAEAALPGRGIEVYTQGLMDLGAMLCHARAPDCGRCPVADDCVARAAALCAVIPAARPRRAPPERALRWLVLLDAGRVLLEKRPPSGVWAGLWSLPEAEPGDDPAAQARQRFGVSVAQAFTLEQVRHGFTHYRLVIEPWVAVVRRRRLVAAEPGSDWPTLAEAARAAVPAPVRDLLERLANGAGNRKTASR